MRKRYGRLGATGPRRRISKRAVVVSVTLGVLAAGTGISLAATQNDAGPVTCIVVQDADAAADANSALSDVFGAGTGLHLVSAGRTVDVTVSGPITAAAAATSAAATTAPAATAGAGGAQAGRKHRNRNQNRNRNGAGAARNVSQAQAVDAAARGRQVSVKAADNDGVDPDTVCVKLSKDAFNTLGNVADGNNVGAFIATMTPEAANKGNGNKGGNANGGNANGNNANGNNGGNANGQAAGNANNGGNANGQAAGNANNGQKNANGERHRKGRVNAGNGQAAAPGAQARTTATRAGWNRR